MLSPEIAQISAESDFVTPRVVSCVAFALHDFTAVYQTAAYAELERRTDRPAQEVIAKDTKLREKNFFVKFT